jgi:peptidoglycan/LPS O-acetylase OafA/YrhL
MVMIHHFLADADPANLGTKLLVRASGFGWSGVDLFFCLSGFLITGILIDTKNDATPLRTFLMRRVLRIFPVYYFTLAIVLFVWPLFSRDPSQFTQIEHNQVWYWTYMTNFLIASRADLGVVNAAHLWSLAVEEQFYIFWPFLALYLSTKHLRIACLGMIVGALIFRIWCLWSGWGTSAAYVLTFSRMDALAAGALLATLVREPALLQRMKAFVPYAAGALAVLLVAVVAIQGSFTRGPLMLTVGFSSIALLSAIIVGAAACERIPSAKSLLELPFLRFFGKYSYSMYIFHPFILTAMIAIPAVAHSLNHAPSALEVIAFSLAGIFITALVSLVSWRVIEQPFLSLKRYFQSSPKAQPLPTPPKNTT